MPLGPDRKTPHGQPLHHYDHGLLARMVQNGRQRDPLGVQHLHALANLVYEVNRAALRAGVEIQIVGPVGYSKLSCGRFRPPVAENI